MKTSNKIVSCFAMIALLASCAEKELADSTVIPAGGSDAVVPARIVATFGETKVTYEEKYDRFRPMWEIGDEIIALDEGGADYTLTVETVNPDNSATLIGEVPETCSLHLIYCPGISASNLTVDYTAQAGTQDTMPAVMLSDGNVYKGGGRFTFRNAGAIIGISAVKGVPSGAAISKITVEGENLSAATVELVGSALALTATEKTGDAISVDGLDLTVTDENGMLSAPVFIAVPAGAKIAKVSTNPIQTREPETMTIPSTAAEKEGVDYVTIAGKKWAKWNVGANSQTDYGWYFPWAGTEGYVYKNSKWVSVSGVDTYSYTLSPAKTANASDYLYVKTQSFTPAGFSFNEVNTPYQTQNTTSDSSLKFTKYLGSTTSKYQDPSATDADALKAVLDTEDDAAHVNWGGSTWRMPTHNEHKALFEACGETGYSYTPKELLSANPNKGIYWVSKEQTLISEYTGVAGILFCDGTSKLFFPFAGVGCDANLNVMGQSGAYWSSTLYSSAPTCAYCLSFDKTDASMRYGPRYEGKSIRAISD